MTREGDRASAEEEIIPENSRSLARKMVPRVKPIFAELTSRSALLCSAEGPQNAKSEGHFADQSQFQGDIAGNSAARAELGWAVLDAGAAKALVRRFGGIFRPENKANFDGKPMAVCPLFCSVAAAEDGEIGNKISKKQSQFLAAANCWSWHGRLSGAELSTWLWFLSRM